jgi:hypothetical protein
MRRRSGARIAGLAALALLVLAAPAGATITPLSAHNDAALGPAVQDTLAGGAFPFTSANFFRDPTGAPTVPPKGNPVGLGDAMSPVLPPFPLDGSNFLVLSTGDADLADDADRLGLFPSQDDIGGAVGGRGTMARDVTVVQIPFSTTDIRGTPAQPACVSFDFRFLSEEYPAESDRPPYDAFIAEIDNSTWTANATISAPNNFASSPLGQALTIASGGPAQMSPADAAGTPYGGGTGLLRAQVFIPATAGVSHTLILSLLDYGDNTRDSAVFLDNFKRTLQPATCPTGLTSLRPAVAVTGPSVASVVDTATPTLTGTAGDNPGDANTVTVRIYGGVSPAGTPVQTLMAPRTGISWAVATQPLAPGQYTVQATQASTHGNGVSAPTTFTVAEPRAVVPQGGSSQQQTPGDKDNDGIPDDQDDSDGSLPPVPGKTFDARVVSGDVFIKYPAGTGPRAVKPLKGFVPLKGAANVPIGAQLDTRKGRVAVTSAADTGGVKTQTSDFYDGIFAVKQALPKTKPKKPATLITDLVLKGEPSRSECAPLKGAAAVAATKKKRGAKSVLGSLWGNGKGKFRTTGKYSSATVRGTIWLTQDRCDGTLTTVKRGVVSVRDFKRKKTVSVKAGHSYLARAARASTKAARKK